MEHLKDMSTVIGGNSESVCQTYLVEKYLLLPEPVRPAMPTLCWVEGVTVTIRFNKLIGYSLEEVGILTKSW